MSECEHGKGFGYAPPIEDWPRCLECGARSIDCERIAQIYGDSEVLKAIFTLAGEGGFEWAVNAAEDSILGDVDEQTEEAWRKAFLDALAIHEGWLSHEEKVSCAARSGEGE